MISLRFQISLGFQDFKIFLSLKSVIKDNADNSRCTEMTSKSIAIFVYYFYAIAKGLKVLHALYSYVITKIPSNKRFQRF